MPTQWEAVRDEFRVLREWVYLNTATFGPVPNCALEAAERHVRGRDERACLDFISWFDDADQVRALAASLIGASADDIAFIPNAIGRALLHNERLM
jgi:selenocysteine lyase/cysteine desulfurase